MVECTLDKLLTEEVITSRIKDFTVDQLKALAAEIRSFLIHNISQTGGHIGANLGIIELTIALHYVFDLEKDKLLFDVGHQGYTHKLLTGRKALFSSLNSINGMSRFISSKESPYDILDASHGGTAVSIGTGIAYANKIDNSDSITVSIVGDGAFVEGMSFEGLNYATQNPLPLLIIINDNGMSIPKNVGSVNHILANKKSASNFFSAMGFNYFFIEDGHDLQSSIHVLEKAKASLQEKTTIVHVKTIKGKGLDIAKDHPYKLHFSMPFDPNDGTSVSPVPAGKTYTEVIANTLHRLMTDDKDIFVLTPSTPYASGLEKLLVDFPKNSIDVGMAEQQAAGMAAGLTMRHKKVFLCYQSTFMQRAMDQIFHDICFMNLPVTIISSRSGFAGFDSPTHHAIYDLSYLRGLPNLEIFYAGSSKDLQEIITHRCHYATKPMVILHPYESIRSDEHHYFRKQKIEENEIIFTGADGYILSIGNRLETAITLRDKLRRYGQHVGVIHIRWVKPFKDESLLSVISKTPFIVTLEENVKNAGFGSIVSELITDNALATPLLRVAIDSDFTQTGDKEYLSTLEKIDCDSIITQLQKKKLFSCSKKQSSF
ncbi:MAG TPA: 1-deoxy-D-xylulose-5-phosphate synthase [Gammaproteobacteria bacterium]|nr:1-deoxy-D-xylulose-5-phosphate synthase [Gammaproteobacteria bacterium]